MKKSLLLHELTENCQHRISGARSWILIGNNEFALDTYRQFFASRPQDPLADNAQWKLANLLEDAGDFEQALAAYVGLAERFPAGDYAAQALFRAGLAHYRLGRYEEARQTWGGVVEGYPSSDERARVLFWLGKASLEYGDTEAGLDHLNAVLATDPTTYYGLRASDLLRGGPAENPMDIYSSDRYDMEDEGERLAFEEWLVSWAGAGEGQPLGEPSPKVTNDPLFQRGLELLNVGQWESAKARFREVRTQFKDDPVALYQLALFFQREGFHDQSIACAQRILSLSPEDSLYDVPSFLQKLHYPVHFVGDADHVQGFLAGLPFCPLEGPEHSFQACIKGAVG